MQRFSRANIGVLARSHGAIVAGSSGGTIDTQALETKSTRLPYKYLNCEKNEAENGVTTPINFFNVTPACPVGRHKEESSPPSGNDVTIVIMIVGPAE